MNKAARDTIAPIVAKLYRRADPNAGDLFIANRMITALIASGHIRDIDAEDPATP